MSKPRYHGICELKLTLFEAQQLLCLLETEIHYRKSRQTPSESSVNKGVWGRLYRMLEEEVEYYEEEKLANG